MQEPAMTVDKKDVAETAAGLTGAAIGWKTGAVIGGILGSAAGPIGTAIGAAVCGKLGALGGCLVGMTAVENVATEPTENEK